MLVSPPVHGVTGGEGPCNREVLPYGTMLVPTGNTSAERLRGLRTFLAILAGIPPS